jgi:hypothetical protein
MFICRVLGHENGLGRGGITFTQSVKWELIRMFQIYPLAN